jgi:hypothetical protein
LLRPSLDWSYVTAGQGRDLIQKLRRSERAADGLGTWPLCASGSVSINSAKRPAQRSRIGRVATMPSSWPAKWVPTLDQCQAYACATGRARARLSAT